MLVSDLSESELIARIQSRLAPPPAWLTVGIGDDAAVVEPEKNRLEVLTTDCLIDGVHFDRRFTPARAIGHRALAANLSDLAAMGAAPRLALLSLALPSDLPAGDFDALTGGLTALAAAAGVTVVGGNLSRTPGPLTVDVTLAGSVKRRHALKRAGARPGDELYVTGTVGTAAAGLRLLRDRSTGRFDRPEVACVHRYLFPSPRVRTGLLLGRNRAATACLDLSDGLAAGLRLLAQASGIGVQIEEEALPLGASRRVFEAAGQDPVVSALDGGDDYELLFAVRPRTRGRLRATVTSGGTTLTKIGICVEGDTALLRRAGGALVPLPVGFSHFGTHS